MNTIYYCVKDDNCFIYKEHRANGKSTWYVLDMLGNWNQVNEIIFPIEDLKRY